jgi:DNA polymerase-3 subunit epsilon
MHLTDVLKLDQPLFGIDLETTGIRSAVDKIVQIAIVRINPDGTEVSWSTLVNPEQSIPVEAAAVHKITNERMEAAIAERQAPTFAALASALYPRLNGKDLLGCNHTGFDNDFLAEAFGKQGLRWKPGRNVDIYRCIQRADPRNLRAILEKVLGAEPSVAVDPNVYLLKDRYGHLLEGEEFHDALFDVRATIAALHGLLLRYPTFPRTVAEIDALFRPAPVEGALDTEAKFVLRDGIVYVNFGKKHNGRRADQVDRGFWGWMVNGNFPADAKALARQFATGNFQVAAPVAEAAPPAGPDPAGTADM